jgi:hypothetical protein
MFYLPLTCNALIFLVSSCDQLTCGANEICVSAGDTYECVCHSDYEGENCQVKGPYDLLYNNYSETPNLIGQ